ncbi:MAG: DUF4062 domain-containing protein [Chloroflexi bacterium]|nr:DUF4062 domain-containing protein [Chloroflexota bacterium]
MNPEELIKLVDVMISSTSKDLTEHRALIARAIRKLGMNHVWMEENLKPVIDAADPAPAITASYELVDQSEIYLLIVGFRYGFIADDPVRNPERLSVTELEYRRAKTAGLPIIALIMKDDHPTPPTAAEARVFFEASDEGLKKLDAFRKHLMDTYLCFQFSSAAEAAELAFDALNDPKVKARAMELAEARLNDRGAEAAVEIAAVRKLPIPAPPALYAVPPYTLTHTFIGRRTELARLDAWAAGTDPLLVIEAIGGMGKSALTWQWVNDRAVPWDAVFWYSFYEGGATMAGFLRHALAYLEGRDPGEGEMRSLRVSGETTARLVARLKERRCLLVLDGFERALVAYHRWDAAQMQDSEADDPAARDKLADPHRDVRACTDPADGGLLRALTGAGADIGASKVLVTSRLLPRDLEDAGHLLKGVVHWPLTGLAPDDALHLMRERGVTIGHPATAEHFLDQFGFHPLIVKIVSGLIVEYRRARGNFDRWHEAEGRDLQLADLPLKARREHILARAYADLPDEARLLLSQIAAFGDAVGYDTLAVFNPYVRPRPPAKLPHSNLWLWVVQSDVDHADTDEARAEAQTEIAALRAENAAAVEAVRRAYDAYLASAEGRTGQRQFNALLKLLEDRGLLRWKRDANLYDLHPVVRGFAFDRLALDRRTAVFDAVRGHFEGLPQVDPDAVKSVDELNALIGIYKALIGAERFDDAAEAYQRFGSTLAYTFGAFRLMEALLLPLFRDGIDQPPALSSPDDWSYFVRELGWAFSRLSRLEEALALVRLNIRIDYEARDARNTAGALLSYASIMSDLNRPGASVRAAELELALAEAAGDAFEVAMARLLLFDHCADAGRDAEAEAHCAEFLAVPFVHKSEYWSNEAKRGRVRMVLRRGEPAAEALESLRVHPIALRELPVLAGEDALNQGEAAAARDHFSDGLAGARTADIPYLIAWAAGGLARALARLGETTAARRLLDEEPIEDLPRAETYLILLGDEGDRKKALEHAVKAHKRACGDGEPWVHRWELNRATAVFTALGEPAPPVPVYDESAREKIPYEDEIRAWIEELKTKKDGDSGDS